MKMNKSESAKSEIFCLLPFAFRSEDNDCHKGSHRVPYPHCLPTLSTVISVFVSNSEHARSLPVPNCTASPMVRMSQSRKNKQLFAQHLSRNNNFISRHFIGLFVLVVIGLVVSVHVYLKNQEVCLTTLLQWKICKFPISPVVIH
jgi:hypothetical protein